MADETVAEEGGTATAAKTYSERVERILSEMEQLSLLEIVELKDGIEERFGVTAAMPAAMAMPMGGGGGAAAEEKTSFDVILKDFGKEKIQVIKEIRGITSLGLKEAKALVEDLPQNVKEGISKEDADKVKEQLEKVGATVEIK